MNNPVYQLRYTGVALTYLTLDFEAASFKLVVYYCF